VWVASTITAHAQQPQPDLYFEGGEADVALTDPTTELTLISNADVGLTVQLEVRIDLEDTDGDAVPTGDIIRVPASVTVAARQPQTFRVSIVEVDRVELGDAGVRGIIVASTADGQLSAEQPVVLTAPNAPAGKPQPAASAWTITYVTDEEVHGATFPLVGGATLAEGQALGVVQSSDGRVLEVTADPVEGSEEVTITVTPEPAAGTSYTGTVDFDTDSDEGSVELTVQATDHIWWPAFVIFLGVGLGLLIKWALGVVVPTNRLKREAKDGRTAARDAEDAFGKRCGDPAAIPVYSIGASADAAKDAADAAIESLSWKATALDTSSDAYNEAVGKIDLLREAGANWGEAAAQELIDLKAQLAAHDALPANAKPSAPTGAAQKAGVVIATRQRLETSSNPGLERPLDKIEEFRGETTWLTEALDGLKPTVKRFTDLGKILDELEAVKASLPDSALRMLERAQRDLAAARWHHWHAASKEDHEERHVDELAAAVDMTIAKLSHHFGSPTRPLALAASNAAPTPSPAVVPVAGPDSIGGVLAYFRNAITGRSGGVINGLAAFVAVIVVFGVGIWTGLTGLDVGESFGSAEDYLGAFAWGLGAATIAAGLDEVAAAMFGQRKAAKATNES
jgi:hypothetical protein